MKSPFQNYMIEALQEAQLAYLAQEVPIGAVIVHNREIIARGQNRTRRDQDPTAHAEIVAIRKASKKLNNYRLLDCDLYVTLEPCAMCAGAIVEARLHSLYFGAEDPKSGGTFHGAKIFQSPSCHHQPNIYSAINEDEAAKLLRKFFMEQRK